ncbi:hypothetical protein [Lujinxingia litoralis]|uniref:hypothetical protein n=1 Tax=Lujinxingia litoralis TaxID=2211119 RepID=UPI0018F4FB39|nr:hypothetical protein [Lujinxingia litoralis]
MPTLSRVFIKFGLVYFVGAMCAGLGMAGSGGVWSAVLWPTYVHLFVVGWITQCIVGVALWLFPRWSKAQPRGPVWLGWVSLVGLNVGLVLRVVAEPAKYALGSSGSVWGWLLVASALLQWGGSLAFVALIWPRIKDPKGARARRRSDGAVGDVARRRCPD